MVSPLNPELVCVSSHPLLNTEGAPDPEGGDNVVGRPKMQISQIKSYHTMQSSKLFGASTCR